MAFVRDISVIEIFLHSMPVPFTISTPFAAVYRTFHAKAQKTTRTRVTRHVNEPHPRIRRKRCDVADAACHENVPSRLKPGLGAADFEGRGGEAQHNSSISSIQRTEEDEKAQLDEEHQRQKREEEDEHSLLLRAGFACESGEGSPQECEASGVWQSAPLPWWQSAGVLRASLQGRRAGW